VAMQDVAYENKIYAMKCHAVVIVRYANSICSHANVIVKCADGICSHANVIVKCADGIVKYADGIVKCADGIVRCADGVVRLVMRGNGCGNLRFNVVKGVGQFCGGMCLGFLFV